MKIVDNQQDLSGYELYIVEQWATSRQYLTSLITTFTGLSHHKVKIHVLEIPSEEKDWSERLRTYIENISQPPARRKDTPYGTLMITNLSSFASTLTVINIPGGDYDRFREIFVINENLKRMGCSGRAGLNLSEPSAAVTAKFRQLYHTSDTVPISEVAIELVRLCQIALVLFAQLAREYTDGFLCDVTIKAIKGWWTQIGSEHFNREPNDGYLGPTTVAALLGLIQGARIRLQSLNAPIGKDVFDLRSTKRAIEAFQKWYKLDRTRRLDPKTLDRLHSLSKKSVTSKEWMVPRTVKSTIPQLGKGGEMVMGMVSNKERAGIGEVETLDMNTFASIAYGDSAKWLWQGKRRKPTAEESVSRFSSDEELFSADDTPVKVNRKRDIMREKLPTIGYLRDGFYNSDIGSQASLIPSDREQPIHKHVLKSVTGRMNDAKSGLGRIRDAVGIPGFRGHTSRFSRDHTGGLQDPFVKNDSTDIAEANHGPKSALDLTSRTDPNRSRGNLKLEQAIPDSKLQPSQNVYLPTLTGQDVVSSPGGMDADHKGILERLYTPSVASQNDTEPAMFDTKDILVRSVSYTEYHGPVEDLEFVPRRALSFGDVSDALGFYQQENTTDSLNQEYALHEYLTELAISSRQRLTSLEASDLAKAKQLIHKLQSSDKHVMQDLESMDRQHISLLAEHHNQQQEAADTTTTARVTIGDTLLRIEGVLSKLEYEVSMLSSKIEDVEDGVADFEDQVIGLETRTQALEPENNKRVGSWTWRSISTLLGLA